MKINKDNTYDFLKIEVISILQQEKYPKSFNYIKDKLGVGVSKSRFSRVVEMLREGSWIMGKGMTTDLGWVIVRDYEPNFLDVVIRRAVTH